MDGTFSSVWVGVDGAISAYLVIQEHEGSGKGRGLARVGADHDVLDENPLAFTQPSGL